MVSGRLFHHLPRERKHGVVHHRAPIADGCIATRECVFHCRNHSCEVANLVFRGPENLLCDRDMTRMDQHRAGEAEALGSLYEHFDRRMVVELRSDDAGHWIHRPAGPAVQHHLGGEIKLFSTLQRRAEPYSTRNVA